MPICFHYKLLYKSILQHKTEWKKIKETVEEVLSFEDDVSVLQKQEAQYSGTCLNSRYLNCL